MPAHAPLALQAVAFVLLQVSVVVCPAVTVVGFAVNVTVGVAAGGGAEAAATFTITDCDVELPPLVPQARVNVVVAATLLMVVDPDRPLEPDQPPDAVQLVAFTAFHVSVTDEFAVMLIELA